MKKIRLSESVIRRYCNSRYDHGIPNNDIQVYTTVSAGFKTPYAKIILEVPEHNYYGRTFYHMAYWIRLRCPQKMMFKEFTLQEFCDRFYGIVNNGKLIIKFYK